MKYGEQILCDGGGKPVLRSFFSTVPSGKREYREHHHSECELSTVLSGEGVYLVNGREYAFLPGDVFLFGGDDFHCLTDIQGELSLLNLRFDLRFLWADADAFPILRLFFARNGSFENRIARNSYTPRIHSDLITLYRELSERREGYSFMAKYLLCSMLLTLVREYGYVDPEADCEGLRNTVRPMRAAMEYIDGNLDRSLSLREIASHAAMSPTYFSAMFRKMNAISPWEYITIKRVERAVELLRTTDLTKLDIAQRCGFSSSSNFYKAFAKVTGKTPSQFCGMRRARTAETGEETDRIPDKAPNGF